VADCLSPTSSIIYQDVAYYLTTVKRRSSKRSLDATLLHSCQTRLYNKLRGQCCIPAV